ncbi:MAG: AraC family transcriptional regulator [Bacilli bacterium]|jgi:YesN/AraC family two-component response regulator|nr:AraC family transcriptional regulator [Bacilli bacterium]
MDKETLLWLGKNDEALAGFEIGVYQGKNKVGFANILADYLTLQGPYADKLISSNKPIDFLFTTEKLMLGIVKDLSSNLSLIVGPVCLAKKDEEDFSKILWQINPPEEKRADVYHQIKTLPNGSFLRFREAIRNLYVMVNHDLAYLEKSSADDAEISKIYSETYKDELQVSENEEMSGGGYAKYFEDLIVNFIRSGMPDKLRDFLPENYKERTLFLEMDDVRAFKDRSISAVAVEVRTAIDSGVDPDQAYSLQDMFLNKIENASDITQLESLHHSAMISLCTYVGQARHNQIANPTIRRVIDYITAHIREKVTSSTISRDLSISLAYLSSRFKEATGMTLMKFITSVKIDEAKNMLKFTSKTLTEISNNLSFSSQSYFQNVFKKEVGMTPKEYREQNKRNKESD